ncbi:MAG: rRNA pseudouridine synthase [Armatimonadetes bacterium]|nr:rRNA pseudouridine synthase [Armatimonadota bacterium]
MDGRPIPTHVPHIYLALGKPAGVVTTREDPHAPRTVLDLIRPGLAARLGPHADAIGAGIHPVGRLDADTEGLLLLTNDGEFTYLLTHPRHQVPKTYEAVVSGIPAPETLRQLAAGIPLEGRMTAPARVRLLAVDRDHRRARVEVELHEGRKRQVRRMLAAVGHPVIELRRTRIGNVTLGRLRPGEWRELRPAEVSGLIALARGEPLPEAPPAARRPHPRRLPRRRTGG